MNLNKINVILLSDKEINHIIYSTKKEDYIIEGGSYFSINPFDKLSLDSALKEISQLVKNNKLVKLIVVNEKVLKYQFILNQNEASNLRIEVLNRFKTAFDIQLNEYYIDFETYNYKNKIIVFVAGINRQFLDSIIRNFKSRKFKLLFLEVDIVSLKRLVTANFPDNVIMNVHFRDDKTIFIVMNEDNLFAFREINFGFTNLIELLCEKTKTQQSLILEQLKQDDFDFGDSLDKLTIELQRTIDFHTSQFRDAPISNLILTGKFLNINNIDKFFSNLFRIKTEKLNGLKKFFVNTNVKKIEEMTYLPEILAQRMTMLKHRLLE
jgi:Tfp pilus assembly PilM family ATPase